MATAAQNIANQSNAQHSTGPRTPEGKARVSQNALRHGLTAKHLVIRNDEREEFATLQDALAAELDPQGAVEILTFRELLHAAWNLQRFRRIEAEVSTASPNDFEDSRNYSVLDRLARYQARAQRAYFKALTELRTLQTNRTLRALKLSGQDAAKVPAIANINQLTKQTQSEVTKEALELAVKMVDYQSGAVLLESRQKRAAQPAASSAPSAAAA